MVCLRRRLHHALPRPCLPLTPAPQDHGFQPCTHLEHALYLGRELQRAEFALVSGQEYVQD